MAFITEPVIALMQYRIQQEELSSRLYKEMSVYLNFNGFSGAAALWDKYSKEEQVHAEVAYEYLLDLDILPVVPTLESPEKNFRGLVDIIKKSYQHELVITEQCNALAEGALEKADFMTLEKAQWYLKEQTEEIAKTKYWLDRLEAFGDSKEALRLLDNEMAEMAQ